MHDFRGSKSMHSFIEKSSFWVLFDTNKLQLIVDHFFLLFQKLDCNHKFGDL